jgi:predicted aspartyl protease
VIRISFYRIVTLIQRWQGGLAGSCSKAVNDIVSHLATKKSVLSVWGKCYILKKYFRQKFDEKIAFLKSECSLLCRKSNRNIVFKKKENGHFSRRKSVTNRKNVIVNIDPRGI